MSEDIKSNNLNDVSKKGVGLFPAEQELMSDMGLYYDTDIEEHFEYYNFDTDTQSAIQEEFKNMLVVLNDAVLLDSIEQFWFANKAGTELDRSLIVHLFKQLPKDFPVGEIYVAFTEGYVSFQIVFMPNNIFPYLTTLMLLQNETSANKEYIQPLIDRFELQDIYTKLKSMKS